MRCTAPSSGRRCCRSAATGRASSARTSRRSSPGAPALYINGAAGNLAPIYTVQDLARSHIGEFRVLLGDKILEANQAMAAGGAEVKLWLGETWIETPRKAELGWSEELKAYGSKSTGGADLVRIPVRVLRINDAVLWGSPVELFCEIALRVRAESPFRHTFFLGYCNGWMGYLPTAPCAPTAATSRAPRRFEAQVERDYTEGVLSFLHGLPRETDPRRPAGTLLSQRRNGEAVLFQRRNAGSRDLAILRRRDAGDSIAPTTLPPATSGSPPSIGSAPGSASIRRPSPPAATPS